MKTAFKLDSRYFFTTYFRDVFTNIFSVREITFAFLQIFALRYLQHIGKINSKPSSETLSTRTAANIQQEIKFEWDSEHVLTDWMHTGFSWLVGKLHICQYRPYLQNTVRIYLYGNRRLNWCLLTNPAICRLFPFALWILLHFTNQTKTELYSKNHLMCKLPSLCNSLCLYPSLNQAAVCWWRKCNFNREWNCTVTPSNM